MLVLDVGYLSCELGEGVVFGMVEFEMPSKVSSCDVICNSLYIVLVFQQHLQLSGAGIHTLSPSGAPSAPFPPQPTYPELPLKPEP